MLGALNSADGGLVNDTGDGGGYIDVLSSSVGGMMIVLVVALFGGIYGGVDIKPAPRESRLGASLLRFVVALAQTATHLLIATLVVYAALQIAHASILVWLLGLAVAFLAGTTIGTTVFAFFMLLVHKVRGEKAQACANQVFTGQSIPDYKNLLRMRLGADGGLTIWPLGVDKACTDWDLAADEHGPRFEPRAGKQPVVHPIDRPLEFDPRGNRL
jgi:hypothetical protein